MWISHRKETRKLTFRLTLETSPRRRANARNVSFRISLRWLIHIISPVDKTQLSCYTSHRRSTTVSLETYPSILWPICFMIRHKMWNILIWCMRIMDSFCHFPIKIFFLPFSFPFYSVVLLLLPFAFHILSGCPKKWVLTKDKAWKWGLDLLELWWVILRPFLHQNW